MNKINELFERFKRFFETRKGKITTISAAAGVLLLVLLIALFMMMKPKAVKVASSDSYATAVTINKSALDLNAGEHDTLTAEVVPSDAKDKTVMWTSSDRSVATVSDGLITAQGEGNAEITASSINGKTAVCNVTVSQLSNSGTSSAVSSSAAAASITSTDSNTTTTANDSTSTKNANTNNNTTTKKNNTTTNKTTTNTNKTTTTTNKTTTTTNKSTDTQTPPPNKDFYKTVSGCNIQYNPAYRSIQAFIDVTSINQTYYNDTLNAKIYRNGVYDSSQSGCYASFIGKTRSSVDVPFGVKDKTVNGILTPIPATFKIVCYHNDTEFKTITFSVNEHGFA